ncbi:MAG TPA: iron ABC transporter permease [Yinghuangia sp.]|uniref:FecCD family ABC transporter permease n=1 Tax=Yinghuangia sp. YIM S10712 TaxID=3436930 RepID=UPI002CF1C8A1|nr:iron ABC transporter permease [Yinghuangia sp.]
MNAGWASRRARVTVLVALLAAAIAVGAAGLFAGRMVAPHEVWAVVTGANDDPLAHHVVMRLRMPRTLVALTAGACLGTAGLLLQASLRNPLAGPEVTGVAPGAVLGAVAASGAGLASWSSPGSVAAAACAGGFLGAGLLWLLTGGRRTDPLMTAVYGVLVSALLSGLTAVVLVAAPGELGSVVQWLVGSTEGRVWEHWHMLGPWALAWGAAAFACAGALGVLRSGDEHAAAVGLAPARTRAYALVCAVALTAGAVAAVGALGFVGLLAPHVATALLGADLRAALPGAALVGAVIVGGSDSAAQALSPPLAELFGSDRFLLPTGAITTGVGALVLLAVARRYAPNEDQ